MTDSFIRNKLAFFSGLSAAVDYIYSSLCISNIEDSTLTLSNKFGVLSVFYTDRYGNTLELEDFPGSLIYDELICFDDKVDVSISLGTYCLIPPVVAASFLEPVLIGFSRIAFSGLEYFKSIMDFLVLSRGVEVSPCSIDNVKQFVSEYSSVLEGLCCAGLASGTILSLNRDGLVRSLSSIIYSDSPCQSSIKVPVISEMVRAFLDQNKDASYLAVIGADSNIMGIGSPVVYSVVNINGLGHGYMIILNSY